MLEALADAREVAESDEKVVHLQAFQTRQNIQGGQTSNGRRPVLELANENGHHLRVAPFVKETGCGFAKPGVGRGKGGVAQHGERGEVEGARARRRRGGLSTPSRCGPW